MTHTRVESKGSIWLIDEVASRYARMPKYEGPRLSPPGEDWGGVTAGSLEDLKWHDMESWKIVDNPIMGYRLVGPDAEFESFETGEVQPLLIIHVPDGTSVVAPDAVVA